MGWQPIETAPRDGTVFLAYIPGALTDLGRYRTVTYTGWGGGVWEDGSFGKWELDAPTGWMPLPEPPDDELRMTPGFEGYDEETGISVSFSGWSWPTTRR